MGQGGDGRPQLEEPAGDGQGARPPVRALDATACAARTSTTARWSRWTTRPATSSPTSGSADPNAPEGDEEVPAPVRRPRRRLAPAGLGVQAGRLLHRASPNKSITAASMFMDVVTNFGGGYTPTDADNLERGPGPGARRPQLLAQHPGREGGHGDRQRRDPGAGRGDGDPVPGRRSVDAGAAFALGVEDVHPLDLVRAYGTHRRPGPARGADHDPHGHRQHRHRRRSRRASARSRPQALDPGAAYIMTDILAGNTNPQQEPVLGPVRDQRRRRAPARRRSRPAPATRRATSTPTASSAPPTTAARKDDEYALAVGAWNGNSDNSLVSAPRRTAVLDRRHDLRLAGLPRGGDQGLEDQRLQGAQQPRARVESTRGRGSRRRAATRSIELFLPGTAPTSASCPRRRAAARRS